MLQIKESRVLLVGAGGIGCEVLKNLVCCGFGTISKPPGATQGADGAEAPQETTNAKTPEIVVIDLDTIDLSNLNRQFLFRKHHIKQPKALVAKETASQFNPSVKIDAHHASIFDARYNVEFFEGFDVVFNALDNLAARRHVNKMCLAANVPLIESGTTGFNGQAQAIKKGVTECYDCNPKPVQKSFPICTIRSTPSQPIHCIVWAKSYLFPELFGSNEEDSADMVVTDGDNAEEVMKLKEEAEALKNIRKLMGTSEFAQHTFNKVFHEDIERLRSMKEMWQSRKAPEPLHFDAHTPASGIVTQGQLLARTDQRVWSLLENIAVFCYSLDSLSKRVHAGESVIEFDKDDKDTLDFVASAANLRSHVFGIPLHSEWEIKQMAGNIIPAIATANALTASLCVFEAFHVLRAEGMRHANSASAPQKPNCSQGKNSLGGCKMVFLTSKSTERMISTQALTPPRADCAVCSPVYAKLELPTTDPQGTLGDLVALLRQRVGYDEFSIAVDALGIIFDPDLEDNLAKPLSEMGIHSQTVGFVTVMDDADEPRVDLVLSVRTQQATQEMRLLPEPISIPRKASTVEPNANVASSLVTGGGIKRKRLVEEDVTTMLKRTKVQTASGNGQDEAMVIEDDGGAIVLDD